MLFSPQGGPFGDDDDDEDHNMFLNCLNGRHTFHMLQHETLAFFVFYVFEKTVDDDEQMTMMMMVMKFIDDAKSPTTTTSSGMTTQVLGS